ncbi:hypothetical protein [Ktedonospora formicarum]|uniref:Uncharacterized protein n=1 Tax=Ktedonospora formicarum TaxID=2778364 RepID=A0A8J3MWG8_9CHLR|nr:hypothetical protein [Ktedonospora formicarum]GHO47570.1 hypothetical protein KSX_57330 [Ktedonospora formicarum]
MELLLKQQTDYQVDVTCDNQCSHTFDVQPLQLLTHWYERLSRDPMGYGQRLFHALFPVNSRASNVLNAHPEHIVLVTTEIDAVNVHDPQAIVLVELLQQLPGPLVSVLITSRIQLGGQEKSHMNWEE